MISNNSIEQPITNQIFNLIDPAKDRWMRIQNNSIIKKKIENQPNR